MRFAVLALLVVVGVVLASPETDELAGGIVCTLCEEFVDVVRKELQKDESDILHVRRNARGRLAATSPGVLLFQKINELCDRATFVLFVYCVACARINTEELDFLKYFVLMLTSNRLDYEKNNRHNNFRKGNPIIDPICKAIMDKQIEKVNNKTLTYNNKIFRA